MFQIENDLLQLFLSVVAPRYDRQPFSATLIPRWHLSSLKLHLCRIESHLPWHFKMEADWSVSLSLHLLQGHLSEGYGKLCSIYLKLLITKMEFHVKVSDLT